MNKRAIYSPENTVQNFHYNAFRPLQPQTSAQRTSLIEIKRYLTSSLESTFSFNLPLMRLFSPQHLNRKLPIIHSVSNEPAESSNYGACAQQKYQLALNKESRMSRSVTTFSVLSFQAMFWYATDSSEAKASRYCVIMLLGGVSSINLCTAAAASSQNTPRVSPGPGNQCCFRALQIKREICQWPSCWHPQTD